VTLREFREKRGLTLEAIGVLSGMDVASISRIERGLQRPRRINVVRLARGLGISAGRMMEMLAETELAALEAASEPLSAGPDVEVVYR
jgi:transcriptional regulator with XRE-family HTH domain